MSKSVGNLNQTRGGDRDRRIVEDLRLAMNSLAELIDAENRALAEHDMDAVKALSANKWTLTRNYRQQMQAVVENPAILKSAADTDRHALRLLGERLNSGAMRNGILLTASIEAASRVMRAVVSGVRQAQERHATSYGKDGVLAGRLAEGRPVAVSYNKEL